MNTAKSKNEFSDFILAALLAYFLALLCFSAGETVVTVSRSATIEESSTGKIYAASESIAADMPFEKSADWGELFRQKPELMLICGDKTSDIIGADNDLALSIVNTTPISILF